MEAVEVTLESSILQYFWCLNVDFEICLLAVQVALEFLQKHVTSIRVGVFDEVSVYRPRKISLFTEIISPPIFIPISTLYSNLTNGYTESNLDSCRLSAGRLGNRDPFPILGKV